EPPPQEGIRKVDPQLFIEETGKTGVSTLWEAASQEVLARLSAGEVVALRTKGNALVVENEKGEYLGQVEPKLALRLLKLIEGGNRYEAAVATVAVGSVKIIIKEVYQDPSMAGRLSFPTKVADGFRPYVKESLLKYGLEEERDVADQTEDSGAWEEESESPQRDVSLFSDEAVRELDGPSSGTDDEEEE
ncbi:MAG: hypothetical protein ABIH46_14220, partial [Chloroflexota bacterium]